MFQTVPGTKFVMLAPFFTLQAGQWQLPYLGQFQQIVSTNLRISGKSDVKIIHLKVYLHRSDALVSKLCIFLTLLVV